MVRVRRQAIRTRALTPTQTIVIMRIIVAQLQAAQQTVMETATVRQLKTETQTIQLTVM